MPPLTCPSCGAEVLAGTRCAKCGRRRPGAGYPAPWPGSPSARRGKILLGAAIVLLIVVALLWVALGSPGAYEPSPRRVVPSGP